MPRGLAPRIIYYLYLMISFISNIKKELILLFRDWVGLLLLFFMPIVLVLLMTNLQDGTTRKLEKEKIDIALVDLDKSLVSKAVLQGLEYSKVFNVITQNSLGDTLDIQSAKKLVEDDVVDVTLLIPKKTTRNIRKIINNEISKQQPLNFNKAKDIDDLEDVEFKIFFNPVIKGTFRQAIISRIHELVANIQTQIIFKSYTKFARSLGGRSNKGDYPIGKVKVKELSLGVFTDKPVPNSTQHNVPAWTVFAIFFIVVPLSGQIISERTEGTSLRLKTLPVRSINFLLPRVLVYSSIALFQSYVLLLIGQYILPLMGLPNLNLSGNIIDFLLFTYIIGLAATSYGLLISVVVKTQHQAAIFGSVSIVLFAAVGGVFVPTYIMSEGMNSLSNISPLKWALNGYYDIFLNNYGIRDLFPDIIKLLLMFVISITLASYLDNRKD